MFSSRTPVGLPPNRLTLALAEARASGQAVIDLTLSNPTRAGFDYPSDLLAPLSDPDALIYAPEPLGLPAARHAIARQYARRGFDVAPDRIVLTASTSEAYSLVFKLLCDPGDEVLVPRPSYPLFDHLTRLDAVRVSAYDLEYHGRWSIDLEGVERAFSSNTRAVLCVHPNNPTGSFVSPSELDRLAAMCVGRDVAIVADEVFSDYELVPGAARGAARLLDRRDVLVFGLGGLSKSIGLPQVKLGWIAIAGPDATVEHALERLEFASDMYLGVSTPVQLAASELLDRGASIRRQIQARVSANFQYLCSRPIEATGCRVLAAEGGWYSVVQVPAYESEEELVLKLLARDRVLVHPGYFYDFPHEAFLIVSLLLPETEFREGVSRLLGNFADVAARPSVE